MKTILLFACILSLFSCSSSDQKVNSRKKGLSGTESRETNSAPVGNQNNSENIVSSGNPFEESIIVDTEVSPNNKTDNRENAGTGNIGDIQPPPNVAGTNTGNNNDLPPGNNPGNPTGNNNGNPPPGENQGGMMGPPPVVPLISELKTNTTCTVPDPPPPPTNLVLTRVFNNVQSNQTIFLTQNGIDQNLWYAMEQGGRVLVFSSVGNGSEISTFINISNRNNFISQGEMGLLGMTFDPGFPNRNYVYLSFNHTQGGRKSKISRFTVNADRKSVDLNSEITLLEVDQPFTNHNGGHIAFGPDGYLYIGMGDGGSGNDPQNHGQNVNTLLGTILRIDVSNSSAANPYTIPPNNPFVGQNGRDEIFAYGLRNPWRFSFDRDNGDLWVGDVGQNAREEIAIVKRGENHGWKIREGLVCRGGGNNCQSNGFVDPILDYGRNLGRSVTGGYVYRGNRIPGLQGTYFYADYQSGRLWRFRQNQAGNAAPEVVANTGMSIASFAEGMDGEVYVINRADGTFHRISQSNQQNNLNNFPQTLSATGCFQQDKPNEPVDSVLPYEVAHTLWSDGALKRRWVSFPPGFAGVPVTNAGKLDLPNGTIFFKEFKLGQRLLETRMFVKHQNGNWGGYSYRWNENGTEANLVTGSPSFAVGNQTWTIPSRSNCFECHNSASGRNLGFEPRQLNTDVGYYGNTANQLDGMIKLGVFSEVDKPKFVLAPKLEPLNSVGASLSAKALSYLDVQCGTCHRPDGTGRGPSDFRFLGSDTALNYCNAEPIAGNLGIANPRILAPADPGRSVLLQRLKSQDQDIRMPVLGVSIPHQEGIQTIENWIANLNACPP